MRHEAKPKVFKPTISLTEEDFAKLIADPAHQISIAEISGAAVGYVFAQLWDRPENPYRYAFKMMYINQLSVRSDARGKGVGQALLSHVLEESRKLGVKRIELDTWVFNQRGVAFFQQFGFEIYNARMCLNC